MAYKKKKKNLSIICVYLDKMLSYFSLNALWFRPFELLLYWNIISGELLHVVDEWDC